MPHQDLEGTPTDRELELAYGLSVQGHYIEVLVVPLALLDDNYPFSVHIGRLTDDFSWYQLVKKPYEGCMVDVYVLPDGKELADKLDNYIGSVTPEGERHGRLVVMLTERPLHSRIHYLARQWEDALLARDIVDLGFCPECQRLCPSETRDGDNGKQYFPPECHRLVDGYCPACGWAA